MAKDKKRLDALLLEVYPEIESREKAKRLIMSGFVYVNGQKEEKAGAMFPSDVTLLLKEKKLPYVSRGGLKLEKAVKEYGISPRGKICFDIGASTGGFTDCMLQNGATEVYAVDVGYGQLDWKLRNDPRVHCLEKTNARYVTEKELPVKASFMSMDISFISITKVLPQVLLRLTDDAELVVLVKPQFEAGREEVGKKGVVRDPKVHLRILKEMTEFFLKEGLTILSLTFSPILGPEGNREYLACLKREPSEELRKAPSEEELLQIVEDSHRSLIE